MKKWRCKHGWEFFALDDDLKYIDCDQGCKRMDFEEITELNAEDYVELWGNDLESENYHSMTSFPGKILFVVEKYIKDEKVLAKIMKELYEGGFD